SSPGELKPVFDAMLSNAARICEAKFGALFLYENGGLSTGAEYDVPAPLAAHFRERDGRPPIPGSTIERVIQTRRPLHVRDLLASAEGLSSPASRLAGARSYIAVPLIKDENVIGAIGMFRQ